jgi:hypothetical protein
VTFGGHTEGIFVIQIEFDSIINDPWGNTKAAFKPSMIISKNAIQI